ncbi:uncharacterized protein BXZ73DRAFT_53950, partial [Epithele typhae]|uniref:uncharacterized protein n=1 Tax=Epithele typhae TaxID=378194 RepID=UPI002008E4AB
MFNFTRNVEDVYGAPDTLISSACPRIPVANFSSFPVKIGKGQLLGIARAPEQWLDHKGSFSVEEIDRMTAHANLVRHLVSQQLHDKGVGLTRAEPEGDLTTARASKDVGEDPLAEEPLEGGPKTSEPPPDDVALEEFLSNLDISSEVRGEDRQRLVEVLTKNRAAFALDGRLGEAKNTECTIPLRANAKEVSLPPFPASPAKREVI